MAFSFQGAEQKLKKNVEIDNSEHVLHFLEYLNSYLTKQMLYDSNTYVKCQTFSSAGPWFLINDEIYLNNVVDST